MVMVVFEVSVSTGVRVSNVLGSFVTALVFTPASELSPPPKRNSTAVYIMLWVMFKGYGCS